MQQYIPENCKTETDIHKRLLSFKYAFNGIRHLLASQANARIHLIASILVVALASFLQVSAMEWCVLILTMTLVWMAEGINTAIELLCDRVSTDHDEVLGRVKDIAAAAVLFAAIASVVIAVFIFVPYLR